MGAAPMQNIGAYGVELKEVFVELSAIDRETLQIEKFNKERCEFGYRESIFKKEARDKYIITSVTLRLNKKPDINIEYEAIESTLILSHSARWPGLRGLPFRPPVARSCPLRAST